MSVRTDKAVLVETLVRTVSISAAKAEALRLAQKSLTVTATPASIEDMLQVRDVIRPPGRPRRDRR